MQAAREFAQAWWIGDSKVGDPSWAGTPPDRWFLTFPRVRGDCRSASVIIRAAVVPTRPKGSQLAPESLSTELWFPWATCVERRAARPGWGARTTSSPGQHAIYRLTATTLASKLVNELVEAADDKHLSKTITRGQPETTRRCSADRSRGAPRAQRKEAASATALRSSARLGALLLLIAQCVYPRPLWSATEPT